MASPEMVAKLATVSQSLDVTSRWFRREVELWRGLSGGADLEDDVETVGFRVTPETNLDTFLEVLEAARDLILAALNEEVANDV